MPTKTVARRGARRPSKRDELVTGIIKLADAIDPDDPGYLEFLRRWGDRYSPRNLQLLWVQCPGATSLHKYETWLRAGMKVREGQKSIRLYQPQDRVDPRKKVTDPDKTSATRVTMMTLFDISQVDLLEPVAIDDPVTLAEVKRLRFEAVQLHPDRHPGKDHDEATDEFRAAWARYEQAKAAAERKPR
jgi:N-terminal domain of anti-restriction factor ArdC